MNNANHLLTDEQKSEMERLRSYFPFRFIWAEFDKKTNKFKCYASTTRRAMNKSAIEGNLVLIAK